MRTNNADPALDSVDPRELALHIAEMYRDVANDSGRVLHFPTPEQLAKSERLRRDEHIRFRRAHIEALPFEDDSFDVTSERARRTSGKYDAYSMSLLALEPVRASRHTSHPHLGGGADVAQAARGQGSSNTTTTEEVPK